MPGHFTHIYTARRVADLLASGKFTDWPDLGSGGDAVASYDPKTCGELMQTWEKFTAIGATTVGSYGPGGDPTSVYGGGPGGPGGYGPPMPPGPGPAISRPRRSQNTISRFLPNTAA